MNSRAPGGGGGGVVFHFPKIKQHLQTKVGALHSNMIFVITIVAFANYYQQWDTQGRVSQAPHRVGLQVSQISCQ